MDYTPTTRKRELLTEIKALRQTCADAYVMFAPKAEDADEIAMLDRLAKASMGLINVATISFQDGRGEGENGCT